MKTTAELERPPQCYCKPTKPSFRWLRGIAKALSWRLCVSIMFVGMLSTIYSSNEILVGVAMCVGALIPYSVVKTIVYFIHEWVWND